MRHPVLAGLGAAGVATGLYAGVVERTWWRLRQVSVPCLAVGAAPVRLLHTSDTHLLDRQDSKKRFLAGLAALQPDLVVHTGDTLAGASGVAAALSAMSGLLQLPGVFCFGSNDYYGPVAKNPLLYLNPRHPRHVGEELPWERLRDAWCAAGWHDVNNARTVLTLADGRRLDVRGVDDPHLRRHDLAAVAGPAVPGALLAIGVVHAPEPEVYDAFIGDGVRLLLSGHTHGGQLRVPGIGALVTNCGIDRARARGLSRHGPAWMHVSPGLGTSPFAPVRFGCRPEVTLLTLTAP
jgi:predicted MPP superfamily phosphohydrolase